MGENSKENPKYLIHKQILQNDEISGATGPICMIEGSMEKSHCVGLQKIITTYTTLRTSPTGLQCNGNLMEEQESL